MVDHVMVLVKNSLHILFAFTHPFTADVGHVDLVDASARGACQLHNGFRFARTRCTVEEAGETRAHPVAGQPFADFGEVLLFKKVA